MLKNERDDQANIVGIAGRKNIHLQVTAILTVFSRN